MNQDNYFKRVHKQTPTRFWVNNVTRDEARMAIDAGAVGCTQNPSYTSKMFSHKDEKAYTMEKLDKILETEKDDSEAQLKLQRELVSKIAEIFMPIYERSGKKSGYVSIQGDPFKEDTDTIIRHVRYNCEKWPNIMAKIPVTKDGLKAFEVLVEEGLPINATEVMAVRQALDVCKVYEKVSRKIKNPVPVYFSHITGIYDEYLKNYVSEKNIDISQDVLWHAGISIAKKVYWMVKENKYQVGFIGGGARGLHHFTEMVGADCCVTINWKGTADELILQDQPVVQHFLRPTPFSIVDELLEKVEDYKRGYLVNAIKPEEYEEFGPVVFFRKMFESAWSSTLDIIKQRRVDLGL